MAYDLAAWEGPRPTDDTAASIEFSGLYRRYLEEYADYEGLACAQ